MSGGLRSQATAGEPPGRSNPPCRAVAYARMDPITSIPLRYVSLNDKGGQPGCISILLHPGRRAKIAGLR